MHRLVVSDVSIGILFEHLFMGLAHKEVFLLFVLHARGGRFINHHAAYRTFHHVDLTSVKLLGSGFELKQDLFLSPSLPSEQAFQD